MIFVILAGAAALRAVAFSGYFGSDDGAYAKLIHQMAHGLFHIGQADLIGPIFKMRLGFNGVSSLFVRLFGTNELSLVIIPFIASMATVGLAYWAASRMWDRRAGLFAAALAGIVPIEVIMATQILTDLPAALLANLGIFLLWQATRAQRPRIGPGFLAGVLFGASWLCRENVAYLAPFVLVWGVVAGRRDVRTLPVFAAAALGALGVLAAECALYLSQTGDWLYRYHVTEQNYNDANGLYYIPKRFQFAGTDAEYALVIVKRLFKLGPAALLTNPDFAAVPLVALVGAAYARLGRDRSFLFASLWLGYLLLVYNFSTSSFQAYQPITVDNSRYVLPVLFPAVLIAGAFLARLTAPAPGELGAERKFWAGVLIAAMALPAAQMLVTQLRKGPDSQAERAVIGYIAPTDRVYTDIRTPDSLEFFWSYPPVMNAHDFKGLNAADIPAGSFVFLNKPKLHFMNTFYGYPYPSFYKERPAGWRELWSAKGSALYQVAE